MIKKTTRKRRKKRHYKTGIHNSPKCKTPIKYRSGWELVVCLTLDANPNVASYEYETIKIPYILSKKSHTYFPDFIITYTDGKKTIVEVKREDKLATKIVIAKAAAARKWIIEQNNGWGYEIWTNKIIEGFSKLLEIKNKKS